MNATRTVLVVLVLLFAWQVGFAQDPPAAQPAPQTQPDNDDTPDRRVVFLPYEDLQRLGGPRGVFLPYAEFERLWRQANARAAQQRPEVDALVYDIGYEGEVRYDPITRQDRATFTASLRLRVMKDGWTTIPLAFQDIAIAEATIAPLDNAEAVAPALLQLRRGGGYNLLLHQAGDAEQSYLVRLTFATGVSELSQQSQTGEQEAWRRITYGLPAGSVVRFNLTVYEPNLEFTITPNLALSAARQEDRTVISTFLGGADRVDVRWKTDIARDAEETTRLRASWETRYDLQQGWVSCVSRVTYEVLQGSVQSVEIQIPEGFRPREVTAQQMATWAWTEGEPRMTVQLRNPATGTFQVNLTLQRTVEDIVAESAMHLPQAIGVTQQTGVVVIYSDPAYEVRIQSARGLTQKNMSELSNWMPGANRVAAYDFLSAENVGLDFEVTRREPRVRLRTIHAWQISENALHYRANFNVMVTQAGIFRLLVEIPEGYRLIEVGPNATTAQRLPRSRTETEGEGEDAVTHRLIEIELRERFLRSFPLFVRLEAETPELNDAPPLAMPTARILSADQGVAIDQEQGQYVVALQDVITAQAVAESLVNLRPMADPGQVFRFENAPEAPELLYPTALLYEYFTAPIAGRVALERKAAQVSVAVVSHTVLTDNRIFRNAFLRFNIAYADVSRFAVRLPDDPRFADVKFEGEHLQQSSAPDPDREGFTRFILDLGGHKARGEYVVWAYWQEPLNLTPGTMADLAFPEIEVLDVSNETGVYLVARKSTVFMYDNPDATENVEIVDPSEVQTQIDFAQARLREKLERTGGEAPPTVTDAYRYQSHPHVLMPKVVRREFKEQVTTVIELLHLDTTIHQDRSSHTNVFLRFRSKAQQSMLIYLPMTIDTRTLQVFLGGARAQIGMQEVDGQYEISLMLDPQDRTGSDEAQAAALSYDIALSGGDLGWFGGIELNAPSFGELPVQEVSWNLNVPKGFDFYDPEGPFAPVEYEGEPQKVYTDDGMWLRAGLMGVQENADIGFQTLGFTRRGGTGTLELRYSESSLSGYVRLIVCILLLALLLWLPLKYGFIDRFALAAVPIGLGVLGAMPDVFHWRALWIDLIIVGVIAMGVHIVRQVYIAQGVARKHHEETLAATAQPAKASAETPDDKPAADTSSTDA